VYFLEQTHNSQFKIQSLNMDLEKLKYPIGAYVSPINITDEDRKQWVKDIAEFPKQLVEVVGKLNTEQLDKPYRPGGWTARQVVHHLADSHMNSYIRFKLALTEANPTVKPYEEKLWAELDDAQSLPVAVSLQILNGLHYRWTHMLTKFTADDWQRTFYHPESKGDYPLDEMLAHYSWHGKHHTAQIAGMQVS